MEKKTAEEAGEGGEIVVIEEALGLQAATGIRAYGQRGSIREATDQKCGGPL